MRKVFKVLIGFALVLALSVPMAVVGSGEVKAAGEVYINEENFPDVNFRAYLLGDDKPGAYSTDDSGKHYYDQDQLDHVTFINCRGKNISSLVGIGFFTSLYYLDCRNNNLIGLDLTNNIGLDELYCSYNQLKSLNLPNSTRLEVVNCGNNQLTSLDITNNTNLEYLAVDGNKLTALDVTKNTALIELSGDNNQLTSINTKNNTALIYIGFNNNKLTNLDLTENTTLKVLYCKNNELTGLNLSINTVLREIYCDNNQLTSLDLSKNDGLVSYGFSGADQAPLADLIIKDKHISLDMKAFIGSGASINNVTITSDNWELDNTTGIASYTGTDFPKELSYTYDTNNGTKKLEVTVSFEAGKYAPTATEYKYSKESGKPLTITFKRETCDSETFWMFKELRVDGEEVNEKYVKLSQGSLNVELAAEFLNSLDNGEHTLSVSFIDGGEATATFTIASKEANDTGTSTSADGTKTPQTGDASDLIAFIIIGALAAAGGAILMVSNKMEEE